MHIGSLIKQACCEQARLIYRGKGGVLKITGSPIVLQLYKVYTFCTIQVHTVESTDNECDNAMP